MNLFKSPEDLIRYCGITEPQEINLRRICHVCKAGIKYRDLNGYEASIVGYNDKATISVSKEVNAARQRFCIGHELGHWMLDRGKPSFKCKSSDIGNNATSVRPIEARANKYAANLLMPEFIFLKEIEGLPVDFNTVQNLKKKFRTSIMATSIRLVCKGSLPAAFLWHNQKDGKLIQCVKWPDLPHSIWIKDEIHHESYAVEVLCKKKKDTGRARRVPAHFWISARNAFDHDIYEHTIQGYGDLTFTMLWWKDEDMLEELM